MSPNGKLVNLVTKYHIDMSVALQILTITRDNEIAEKAAVLYKEGWMLEIIKEMIIAKIPFEQIRHYYIYRYKWNGSPGQFILEMKRLNKIEYSSGQIAEDIN